MAWETSRLERKLTILKGTFHGETRFYIAPFHTVKTPDGQVYTEPNSGPMVNSAELYRFTELEVRDADSYGTLPNYRVNGGKFVTETVQGPSFASVYPGKNEAE